MFPNLRDRTREAVGRAVDRALELATLGEYRYVADERAVDAVAARRRPRVRPARERRPAPVPSPTMLARRLGAATPAGRRAAATAAEPVTAAPAVATVPDAVRVSPPRVRVRGGAVPPAPQECVVMAGIER